MLAGQSAGRPVRALGTDDHSRWLAPWIWRGARSFRRNTRRREPEHGPRIVRRAATGTSEAYGAAREGHAANAQAAACLLVSIGTEAIVFRICEAIW